jgi:hypothetical protein
MDLNELKKRANERYKNIEKVSNIYKFNISLSTIEHTYDNTIKELDKEYTRYKKNEAGYNLFTSDDLKQRYLQQQTLEIYNKFIKNTDQFTQINIEQNLHHMDEMQKKNDSLQKQHDISAEYITNFITSVNNNKIHMLIDPTDIELHTLFT